MTQKRAVNTKEQLLRTGSELFRRQGFAATTVDEICAQAGVTKGAFFHHFESKEALADACLVQWDCNATGMDEAAPFQQIGDPLDRLLASMDFYIGLLEDPQLFKSCLAGTTAQEVANTNPKLCEAANNCLSNQQRRFQAELDDACRDKHLQLDTASLAALWIATVQGALVLYKASKDESVIPATLAHVREYIRSLFERGS